MATSTITNTITNPAGTAVSGVRVVARLMPCGGFRTADSTEVSREVETVTNGSGVWSLVLEENASITPSNTYYRIVEHIPASQGGPQTWNISVGASDQTVLAALVDPPPAATASSYLTQASADARYQALGSLGSGTPATETPDHAGTAGVSSSASRADHAHPIATAAPSNTGDANSEGVSTSFARADHVHKGVVANEAGTAWTPVITQSSTPTQTVVWAKYFRRGREITAWFALSFQGAGTSTNAIALTGLPVAAADAAAISGTFRYFDAGNTNFAGTARGSIATAVVFNYQGYGNDFGNGDITIASGDTIQGVITYEAAS